MKTRYLLALLLAGVPFLIAAQDMPVWRQQLELQLLKQEGCRVNFLSNIQVKVVNGAQAVFARAHCTDSRAFDVSRTDPKKPFKVEECATTAC